jgi:hypothetical protein
MGKQKRYRPKSGNGQEPKSGYKNPPQHSRFQPGQSGNPRGLVKGVRNLKTDVMATLAKPVKVNAEGRTRKVSTQESALLVLREKALCGDARALERLLDLAHRFNNDMAEIAPAQPLSADDQAILAAFVADHAAAAMPPTTEESSSEPTLKAESSSTPDLKRGTGSDTKAPK